MTNWQELAYINIFKPILFRQDPEVVHDRLLRAVNYVNDSSLLKNLTSKLFNYSHPSLVQDIWGIRFPNPVGLSAGFDKDGHLSPLLESLGFGFGQVGSVTNLPYVGNQPPRAVRFPEDKSVWVNYGLKNEGVEKVVNRLSHQTVHIPRSVSIAKTNSRETCSDEEAILDYKACLEKVLNAGVSDIITINISCPNTFGGEPFTEATRLDNLLKVLLSEKPNQPIWLKMPINKSWEDFRPLVDVAINHSVDALVIGNLNKDFKPTISRKLPKNTGGYSGLPTKELSNRLISQTYRYAKDKIKVVGTGGIFSAEDVLEKVKLGASLVQLITGMLYRGPGVVSAINQKLVILLKQQGYAQISDAIGAIHR